MKTFINKAINQGVYKGENEVAKFKLKNEPGTRAYLTTNEVERLEKLYKSDKLTENKRNVLGYFLFACYTGLRYKDITDLKYKNVKKEIYKDNNNNEKIYNFIEIVMHKTKKTVKIPLLQKAIDLLPKQKIHSKETLVFKVLKSATNRYLKEFAKAVYIDKDVSFHVSRHTFATNSLDFNIPIEVIKDLLGHTDIKTTQIYAKVSNKLKFTEMKKME